MNRATAVHDRQRVGRRRRGRAMAVAVVAVVLAGQHMAAASSGRVSSLGVRPDGAAGIGVAPEDLVGAAGAQPRRAGRFDLRPQAGEYRYVVRTDGTAALDRVSARLAGMSVTPVDRFDRVLSALVVLATPGRAAALERLPGVVSVSREVPMRAAGAAPTVGGRPRVTSPVGAQGTQVFPSGTGLWGLDRIDQRSRTLDNRYLYANAGVGVLAYVVDSGLRASHVEFRGRVSLARSYYVPFPDQPTGIGDCQGHGTGVAGILGGTTTGVAKGVVIAAVKVLDCAGSGSDATVIAGLEHVLDSRPPGVPVVVNLSVAGPASAVLNAAVQSVVDAGITVVVAAGNSGMPACGYSPASATAAITVGATDRSDAEALFSNFGSCVDILAPGVSIRMAYPYTTLSNDQGSDTMFMDFSGTSAATPFVAAAAALVLQRDPSATPAQVWSSLLGAATLGAVTERTTLNGVPISPRTPDRLLFVEQIAAVPPGVDGMNAFRAPLRFVDTRPTTNGTNFRGVLEQGDEATPLATGEVRRYPMVGVNGIPEGVTAALSVVAVTPDSGGYLTVWPCAATTDPRPVISYLNFAAGQTIANGGYVGIGPEGGLCVYASRRAHLVIDVVGWVPPGDTMSALAPPLRLLDTRPTTTGTDLRGALEASADESTPLAASEVRRYAVAGVGSLPAAMRAVVLNVAAVGSAAAGELSVYPCDSPGDTPPPTTTVAFAAGAVAAAATLSVVSAGGAVCVRSTAVVHVVLDAFAWISSGAGFDTFAAPSQPVRLVDTRPGVVGSLETVDRTTPLPAQSTGGTEFVVAGSGGLPSAAMLGSVTLTVTVRSPAAGGFVRVWACASGSSTAPTASVLNFRAGVSVSNLVISAVDNTSGTAGGICVQVSSTVHVSIDVSGWFLRSPP